MAVHNTYVEELMLELNNESSFFHWIKEAVMWGNLYKDSIYARHSSKYIAGIQFS